MINKSERTDEITELDRELVQYRCALEMEIAGLRAELAKHKVKQELDATEIFAHLMLRSDACDDGRANIAIEDLEQALSGFVVKQESGLVERFDRDIANDFGTRPSDKQEWVSVEDRLPINCGEYAVICHYEGETCDGYIVCEPSCYKEIMKISFAEDKEILCNSQFDSEWECVVYWMPLPESPKEV